MMPPEENYKYILTVLDGYTRYAWAVPLKHKDGLTVSNAFKDIMKKSKRKPNKLCLLTKGKSFITSTCTSYLNLKRKTS